TAWPARASAIAAFAPPPPRRATAAPPAPVRPGCNGPSRCTTSSWLTPPATTMRATPASLRSSRLRDAPCDICGMSKRPAANGPREDDTRQRPRRKLRADLALVEAGLAESRSRAQALILAGLAYEGTRRIGKPGESVAGDAALSVKGRDHPWVSRGGLK